MIERSRRRVGAGRLTGVAQRLLDESTLCAIATVSPRGRAHVGTAYFAWSRELRLVWLSARQATHSRNLRSNASTALAVYDSNQTWGEPDRGIQLFGTAQESVGDSVTAAESLYGLRFPAYGAGELSDYRFYVFRPHRIKLFDETSFGGGVFVSAMVGDGGRLSWEKTEIYRSTS